MNHDRPRRSAAPARWLALLAIVLAACTTPRATTTRSGTATYRERIALPSAAVFEATLEEVSRADAPALLAKLGEVGTLVMTRLLACVLLCIGISIMWAGWAELNGIALAPG